MKKKVQKTLSKRCPECGNRLRIVIEGFESKDVDYSNVSFIECSACGYQELHRDHRKGREKFHGLE